MKIAIFILLSLSLSDLLFAGHVNLLNRDFSLSNGKIAYRGSSSKLGPTTINVMKVWKLINRKQLM